MKVAEQALGDLDEIWSFSAHRWGDAQADRYLLKAHATIADLVASPGSGRRVGLRYHFRRFGRHRIFYRYDDVEVSVLRILHDGMDERRHLP